jgi:hypothetical protein
MKVGEVGRIRFHLVHGILVTKTTINGIRILSILPHHRGEGGHDHHHYHTKEVIASQRIIITSVAGSPVVLMIMIRAKRIRENGKMGRGGEERRRRGWRR